MERKRARSEIPLNIQEVITMYQLEEHEEVYPGVICFLLAGVLVMQGCARSKETGTFTNKTTHEHVKGESMEHNRLKSEKSLYLLQHANNPVHWYPWGDAAFKKATEENKPIFLSIGYSTCHWCHVMEHESFEDEQVAALMNDAFVSIKVDREERPDIDNVYMTVCQMITGSGGWPLTIVMTPDKEPFFAATYIPKKSQFGRKGMIELIPEIKEAWEKEQKELIGQASRVTKALSTISKSNAAQSPGEEILERAFSDFTTSYDKIHGGFGSNTKFPTPHNLVFLLRYWHRTGNREALAMVEHTLTAMRHGGIFDQIGYGFHRYTTERTWLIPHFEKMLYDQALLMWAFAETYEATGNAFYADVVREIARYVLTEMTADEGGFYSAEDADSEGIEGKFYLWTKEQINQILKKDAAEVVTDRFGVTPGGNFHEEGLAGGSTILSMPDGTGWKGPDGMTADEVDNHLEQGRKVLLAKRQKRVRPLLDDKILTDWNGLMIGAFAIAGRALNEPSYTNTAKKAAAFILNDISQKNGKLLHRYRAGEAGLDGTLDDYAFMVFGLLELYQTTYETSFLKQAIRLNDIMIELFEDSRDGSFFMSSTAATDLLVRPKEYYDGAIPSGNSMAVYNLVRLARLTGKSHYSTSAAKAAGAFSNSVNRSPASHSLFLIGLDMAFGPSMEIVLVAEETSSDLNKMLSALQKNYLPRKVVMVKTNQNETDLSQLARFTTSQTVKSEQATAYVCVENACSFPTNDPVKMMQLIKERLFK